MLENNLINNSDSELNKVLEPFDVNKYNNGKLISLINSEKKNFFDKNKIEVIKLIQDEVFNHLDKKCLKDLTKENIEALVEADKIESLPNIFLNHINESIFKEISDKFYKKIKEEQITNANEKILKKLIELEKFIHLNAKSFKSFCQTIKFSNLDIQDISPILKVLKERKKIHYITGINFISLGNFINNKEIDPYLKDLLKLHYIDNNPNLDSFFYKNKNLSILELSDIINEEKIIIKYDEISTKIENYLFNEDYELLKTYCIKCSRNVNYNEKMLNTLNAQLKYSKDDINDLIEEFKIRKILIILYKEKEIEIQQYTRIKQIIKEMMSLDLSDPDDLISRIDLFSEIMNEKSFNIDFLEILAEDNLRSIKNVISKFYNGSDKNAVPNELKKIHIKVLNDYMNIIEKKYKVDKNKILTDLQKIDKENQKEELVLFEKSLKKYEKIYYDLLIQMILEQPDSESWIESNATPIFKFIRDICISIGSVKLASMTGSKILTTISASAAGALIFKDVKDEIVKKYFSLKEEERRVYHLNRKSELKKRFDVIKKKIKKQYKKIITPIKNIAKKIIDVKILKLREEPKIGFEKLLNYKEDNQIACEDFRNNEITLYYERITKLIILKYKFILTKIKKKYEEKNISSKSKEITKFFEVKKKVVSKIVDNKINKLKEKYPEFKNETINTIINGLNKICSFGLGIGKSFCNVFSFGLSTNYFAKNKVDNLLEMIKNLKYNEFENKLQKIEKKKEDYNYFILRDDIEYLSKLSAQDFEIFGLMNSNKKSELNEIREEIAKLQPNLLDVIELKDQKNKIKENGIINETNNNEEFIENESVNDSCDLNERLLSIDESEYDENSIINTQSH